MEVLASMPVATSMPKAMPLELPFARNDGIASV
jgi:hypothetical protein